ncbi:MAG: hypothetical protein IKV59_07380 [Lachnospiraceae bacterium]|nr:hypothetical protein [Lachnospiraceae bacterium]
MHKIIKQSEPDHFRLWKQNFRNVNGRDAVYDDLMETSEYGMLKNSLLEEQGYICCYCEKAIGRGGMRDCNIEHFMPRHPDSRFLSSQECEQCKNAQMDYANLFASCLGEHAYSADHCNHKKDNWFDFEVCVSPAEDEIETLFGFRADGKIFAIGSNKKGEELRRHLGLDSYVLNEQRKAAYDTVMEIEFGSDELLDDVSYIADTISFYKQKDERGYYTPFCSMITYCLQHELLD